MRLRTAVSLAMAFILIGSGAVASPQPSCKLWGHAEFFQSATPDDIRACIQDPAQVSRRNPDTGATPLHDAVVSTSDVDLILVLLEADADTSATDLDGYKPMHRAAAEGKNPEIITYLAAFQAEVNSPRYNNYERCPDKWREKCATIPLHLAASRPDGAPFIMALLAAGSNSQTRNVDGRSALHYAAAVSSNTGTVRALLLWGTPVDIKDSSGQTPLHKALNQQDPDISIVDLLISRGASVDRPDNDGLRPLMLGARKLANHDVLKLLIESSEDPCQPDAKERTLLSQWDKNPGLEKNELYWQLHEKCPR